MANKWRSMSIYWRITPFIGQNRLWTRSYPPYLQLKLENKNGFHLSFIESKEVDRKRSALSKEKPPSQSTLSPAASISSHVTPIPFTTSIPPVTFLSSTVTSQSSSLSFSFASLSSSLSSLVFSGPSS